jgi:hypothetical protein
VGQIARCFYYFFMIVVVIRYKTKATARRALTFIVRIFVNDSIAIAVRTSFMCVVPASFPVGLLLYKFALAFPLIIRAQIPSARFHQILPWLGGNGSSSRWRRELDA